MFLFFRKILRQFFTLTPLEKGSWKGFFRAGIASCVSLIVSAFVFGPNLGASALFGSNVAQWETARPLFSRIMTIVVVGSTIIFSVVFGVFLSSQQWIVLPVLVIWVFICAISYFSFNISGGPGPFNLSYGFAIGVYLGQFPQVANHLIIVTIFSVLVAGCFSLTYLFNDWYRPERTIIAMARSKVTEYGSGKKNQLTTEQLRKLRNQAYSAVNGAWLYLQSAKMGRFSFPYQKEFEYFNLLTHQRLSTLVASRYYPDLPLKPISKIKFVLHGRPSLCYLFIHGFRFWSSPRFASTRIAITAGIAMFVSLIAGFEHAYWTVLTATLIVNQWIDRIATTTRALHRAFGTLVGICIFAGISLLGMSGWQYIYWMVALTIMQSLVLPRNYALGVIFLTPVALLSVTANTPVYSLHDLLADRMIETFLGALIAIIVTWTTGYKSTHRLIRAQSKQTLEAIKRVLKHIEENDLYSKRAIEHRAQLQFEVIHNTAVLVTAVADNAKLSGWYEVETAIADMGYATFSACWLQEPLDKDRARLARIRVEDTILQIPKPLSREKDNAHALAEKINNAINTLTDNHHF